MTDPTVHRFGGLEEQRDRFGREWRGTCHCGYKTEWWKSKQAAYEKLADHFIATPEFQDILARQAIARALERLIHDRRN